MGSNVLLGRILDNERGKLVAHIQLEHVTTGLAAGRNDALFAVHLNDRLGVLALLAEHKLFDKTIQKILKL
jgi:hypothetical protein